MRDTPKNVIHVNPVIMRFLLFSLSEDKDKLENEVRCHLQRLLPGKLRAKPVQHPATPALITANFFNFIRK